MTGKQSAPALLCNVHCGYCKILYDCFTEISPWMHTLNHYN